MLTLLSTCSVGLMHPLNVLLFIPDIGILSDLIDVQQLRVSYGIVHIKTNKALHM